MACSILPGERVDRSRIGARLDPARRPLIADRAPGPESRDQWSARRRPFRKSDGVLGRSVGSRGPRRDPAAHRGSVRGLRTRECRARRFVRCSSRRRATRIFRSPKALRGGDLVRSQFAAGEERHVGRILSNTRQRGFGLQDTNLGQLAAPNRNAVIFACSSAAIRNSLSGSLSIRSRNCVSIVVASSPAAQMMKMKPNFRR